MYRRGSFFLRALGIVLFIVALIAGGAIIYQAGQAQGYLLGSSAASREAPTTAPGAPFVPAYPPYFWPHFGFFPFGGLLGVIGMVLLFSFVLRLVFWPHGWHHAAPGAHAEHWHGKPHPWGEAPWMRERQPGEDSEAEQPKPTDQPPAGTEE